MTASDDALVHVLVSGASLAGLWVLSFWGYRKYRIDKFRQELFALRDSLFDEALEGSLSFEDDAYRALRQTMNGYIRFGHRLNLLTTVLFALFLRKEGQQWIAEHGFNRQWAVLLRDLPEEKRNLLQNYRKRMERKVVEQLVYGSPVLVLTVIPVLLFLVLLALQVRIAKRARSLWQRTVGDQIDGAALAAGQPS